MCDITSVNKWWSGLQPESFVDMVTFIVQYWSFNSEFCACQASSLPLEPWPQIQLLAFLFSDSLVFLPGALDHDPPRSASQIAEIIGILHKRKSELCYWRRVGGSGWQVNGLCDEVGLKNRLRWGRDEEVGRFLGDRKPVKVFKQALLKFYFSKYG